MLKTAPVGFDSVRLYGAAVDAALRYEDAGLVQGKIREIPGKTLGAWLRVKYSLRAAEVIEKEKDVFLASAKAEVEACKYPKLQRKLRLMGSGAD